MYIAYASRFQESYLVNIKFITGTKLVLGKPINSRFLRFILTVIRARARKQEIYKSGYQVRD